MSQVDLLHLKAFVAVAREGTVSRAAQTLHLSQPAVSLQLKSLQERLGLELFMRSGRGLHLTRDGVSLLTHAEKALGALSEFTQAATSLHHSLRGKLRIGTILDPEFIRLGAFLKELVESSPQIETELSQHMSGDVLQQVQSGELDVGFYLATPAELAHLRDRAQGNNSPTPHAGFFERNAASSHTNTAQVAIEFVAIELTSFRYMVLAPAGWGPQVIGKDWRALAQLPWIMTPAPSAHHRLLRSVMEPLALQPKRAALVDQEASMLDLVRSGVGLSLARDTIAMREVQARGLAVADRVHLDCCLCFVYALAQANSAVVQAASQALRRVWN
jgi:DNA-binding transcriptional LysR family regulator